jgi:predicted TIM-barrel fold metal-dependent hydrolase
VRRLVDTGRTWIKLSGVYQDSRVGPPSYADTAAIAKAMVRLAPERLVWGTDWPHPTVRTDKPEDAALLDLLAIWVSDAETRNQILVANPEALYGFPKTG